MLVVTMNPSLGTSFSSWFYNSLCFVLVSNLFISSVLSSPSYTDHCSSIVPESIPTHPTYQIHVPSVGTSYYTGGERLIDEKPLNQSYDYVGKLLRISVTPESYETNNMHVYKVQGSLFIRSPYRHNYNLSYDGSYYHRRTYYRSNRIRFSLRGFWSESSRKLCMVGSASWKSNEGKAIDLDAVLKMNYFSLNPSMFTSVISGTLESTSSVKDSGYFEPISMFSFPSVPNYVYSLVSKELGGGHSGGFEGPKDQSLDLDSSRFCSVLFLRGFLFFELEYGRECNKPQTCSPLGVVNGFFPRVVSLYPIQCSTEERKIRFLVKFQNVSYTAFYENFDLNVTLIGEGSWDDKKNQLLLVACRILDPVNHFGNGVEDCSLRLSFRYPSILTIRNNAKIVGKIWTNKTVDDSGYFGNINLTSTDGNLAGPFLGSKYEYTELDKVKKLCRVEKVEKNKGNKYPDGQSYNMRFDMSVENSNGKKFAWGYMVPISVGNELYQGDKGLALAPESSPEVDAVVELFSEPPKSRSGPLNISFTISITPFHAKLNRSLSQTRMEITAEGVYDSETGSLCMVGCRKLPSNVKTPDNDSTDCEILVNFKFAPINDKRGDVSSGKIRSTRARTNPLYFEDMMLSSAAFYTSAAEHSLWRMDLEITMVLISNTFMCIFVGLQLFHVKRNPEVVSSISLVMLLILSLGYMIPLVLNFEAMFLKNYDKQSFMFSSSAGWLETNEVAVRLVIMVAFLLQIRLLQLVWTAKRSEGNEKGLWGAEKKAAFLSVPMYIFGGLITLLLNWIKSKNLEMNSYVEYHPVYYSLWGYLRSYAGLILDGFLLPQILLNTFSGSSAKALSNPFYIGTSAVRLVPHAYDQYRAHNFPRTIVNGTYYYANPTADFYSTAWDVIIPCGVVALAVIVFLQQRHGGRWILPRRFRESELYEKVPAVNNGL